ncbi:hypothetical protein D5R81_08900 [Parashewanella spongiae]|uniref:Uncharacterized protein n=1 Tax=Parashewanella spongiae TaxID=342950 RepID=A0A3A6U4Z1_9GAMM|nr:hypothetical protein [Parashewanella spongiae]MCL1078088.1 hypothetical protein [Parashewanella spongiae]RJY16458.1 hypothetical protein D5R81_08900 [Parashewanella spongiae]
MADSKTLLAACSYSTCKSYNEDGSDFSKLVSLEYFTHWVKDMLIKSSYFLSSYSYTQRSTGVFRLNTQSHWILVFTGMTGYKVYDFCSKNIHAFTMVAQPSKQFKKYQLTVQRENYGILY